MAEYGPLETYPGVTAAADLSGKVYHLVRFSAARTVNQASEAVNSGLAGVLQNKPDASGQPATVAYLGVSKVVAGGTITANDWLTTDSSGRAITAASGDMICGRALVAGAAAATITAFLQPPTRLSGAV